MIFWVWALIMARQNDFCYAIFGEIFEFKKLNACQLGAAWGMYEQGHRLILFKLYKMYSLDLPIEKIYFEYVG